MGKILTVNPLKKTFTAEEKPIFSNLNLEIKKGEFLGLTGPSASGKTTLLRILAGLIPKDSGEILIKGEKLLPVGHPKRNLENTPVQLLFQNAHGSFNHRNNLQEAFKEVFQFSNKNFNNKELKVLLDHFELKEEDLKKLPKELSGGMIQRFQIIRALLTEPEILLADEITSALAIPLKLKIMEYLNSERENRNLSILFVSHDVELLEVSCDRVLSRRDNNLKFH